SAPVRRGRARHRSPNPDLGSSQATLSMASRFRAMESRAPGARRLSVAEQLARVRMTWPSLKAWRDGNTLVIAGDVQPTPLSDTYRVRVVYGGTSVPKAFVESPPLRPRDDGTPIPHMYPGPRPCLYLPGGGEWTNRKFVATTIIPWLMLWLAYYELWHATGVWQGGGVHPPKSSDDAVTPDQKSETEASP